MDKGIPRRWLDFDEMSENELDRRLIVCDAHLKALLKREKRHALTMAQLSVKKFLIAEIGGAQTVIEIRTNPLYKKTG